MFKALLSFILVFSIWISTLHHHSDEKPHYDCPICLFQLNNSSEEIQNFQVIFFIKKSPLPKPEKTYEIIITVKTNHFYQRAPPLII